MSETRLTVTTATPLTPSGANTTNPAAVYLASLAPTGRYSTMRTLDRVADLMGHSWET